MRSVSFVGRGDGLVKTLGGFDRARHSVPDAVNAATSAFLARLCATELTTEAEEWFQRTRGSLAYKRKDLTLDVTPPAAVLTARDFTLELAYALRPSAPAEYEVTRTLSGVQDAAWLARAEVDALWAEAFSELVFALTQGVRVEDVVDAVEGLPEAGASDGEEKARLRVDYPSDCRHCVLTVPGVAAEVRCDGATLAMQFPRRSSPRELWLGFVAVREAFGLTRERALATLLR